MCNLSDGIEERGIIKGRAEGKRKEEQNSSNNKFKKKLAKGQSIEVIAEDLVEDVEVIQDNCG